MKIKEFILIILLICTFQFCSYGQVSNRISPVKSTLLIDSLENLLPDATLYEKATLYDTLGALSKSLSSAQSLNYYLKLNSLPDSVTGFKLKVFTIKKIADIFLENHQMDKANEFFALLNEKLKNYPQETGRQFLREMAQGELPDNTSHAISKNEILFLLLFLIVMAIFYLGYLFRKFNETRKMKNRIVMEVSIIKRKNQEVEDELEKIVLSKTSVEEAKVDEVRKKYIKLKKELKFIEESIYKRNAFLSSIRPELRTSLSSVLGFASELKSSIERLGNGELTENASLLYAKAVHLNTILEDLGDMASYQINVLKFEIKRVNLTEVVETAVKLYNQVPENAKATLLFEKGDSIPIISADKGGLIRILRSILLNIFGQISDVVTIGVEYLEQELKVVIHINCLAKVISKEELIEFKKALNSSNGLKINNKLYSRLGLDIARVYISRFNGSIEVESSREKGTSVSIFLPVEENMINNDEPQKAPINMGDKTEDIEIFLVEDDRMNRLVIETMLKHTGNVTVAVDGEETMKIVGDNYHQGKLFDIMLFDINLPAPWDGILLLHKIREDYPEYRKIPFVAQTAYAMASDRERFLNEGFDDYLTKPINKGELITIIHHQLELFKNQNLKSDSEE